jgi:hypothetical protein
LGESSGMTASLAREDQEEPPIPRPSSGRVLSGPQFWEVMARWHVPDALALDLIGFPGKIGASGKRP